MGVTFSSQNTFTDGLDLLCHHAQKAQALVDLHVLKHKTVSGKYIIDLFDTLVKPVLTYGTAVYGIQNCMVVEKLYIKFLNKILKVKTSTNTCMIYAEIGRYPLSIDIKLNMIKHCLTIIRSDNNNLICLVYCSMKDCSVRVSKRNNWVLNITEILYSTGFGYVWEQQTVNNEYSGSNYDSLFARTVAYPVQVAYWNQRGHSPLRIQCPMSNLTSGPETWPWGPVGW